MVAPAVLHIDTGRRFRGGQRQVFLLADKLRDHDLEQIVACPKNSELASRLQGIETFTLSRHSLVRKLFAGGMKRLLKDAHLNIIHAHDSEAHTLGSILKKHYPQLKLVVTRRVVFPPSSRVSVKYKYLTQVDRYIAISTSVAESLSAIGVNRKHIEIIPSGLDLKEETDILKNCNELTELSDRYDYIMVSAGALTREKDLLTAIDAFTLASKEISGLAFLIFGEGPMRRSIEKKLTKEGITDIYLFGFHEPLAPVLKMADLFLLTSRSEGLNTATLEAMACGLPVVVSNTGGLPDLVENGQNGILCEPGRPESFAEAIVDLLKDDPRRKKMAENGLARARQFDILKVVERIAELYHRLLQS